MIGKAQRPAIRYPLGGLLAFGALNAFGGGYYGLAGAPGVPTEWLEGSAWMQPTTAIVGMVVLVLASRLPRPQ